jgi:hypothetical protein
VIVLNVKQIGSMVKLGKVDYSLAGIFKRGVVGVSAEKNIIYFTGVNVRGPYNLWVPGLGEVINRLKNNQKALLKTGNIFIPDADICLSLKKSTRWLPFQPLQPGSTAEIKQAVHQTITSTIEAKLTGSVPFLSLIEQWGYQVLDSNESGSFGKLGMLVKDLNDALQKGNLIKAQNAGIKCLGLGDGLTPAGDDLLAGILMALSIDGNLKSLGFAKVRSFCNMIISEAYHRTNLISAAFLNAAMSEEANEPMRPILDLLLEGKKTPFNLLMQLSNVGHTSGFDGLAGVLLGIRFRNKIMNNHNKSFEY